MAESHQSPRPIRRPSRLRAVWLSYRTRWLLWLLLLGAVVVFSTAAVQLWPTQYHNLGPHQPNQEPVLVTSSALPDRPQPAPNANVFFRNDGVLDGKEPDWSKLRSLTPYSGVEHCRPLWQPGAMSLLESVTLHGNVTDQQVTALCNLYDLKSLSLTSAGELTDSAMESLAAEPRLEFLQLGNLLPHITTVVPGEAPEAVEERKARTSRLLHNAVSLKWPSSLRTLIFEDVVGTPQSRLAEWQQLPGLRTLATRLQPIEGTRLNGEAIETLRRFPQLRQLFLREDRETESELAVEQQRLLPRVRVRPFNYAPARGRRASLILVGGLMLFALAAVQVSTQFVGPASLLTPHFAKFHFGVVAGGLAVLVVGSFAGLLVAGCPITVALALCGASVLMLALPARLMRNSMGVPTPGFTNFPLIMPSVIFPFLGLQLATFIFGAEFDWFLRGQHPWITWGLLAASIWGAFDLVTWHLTLPRRLEEAGCANAPLGIFDTAGWAEWTRTIMALREARGKKPPLAMLGRDAELDRFAESLHERRGRTALALWQLANVQSMWKFLLFFTSILVPLMALAAGAIYLTNAQWDPTFARSGLNYLGPMVGQVLFMLLFMPFAFAWQRRPLLAMELLRPIDRRDWVRTWFRGIAIELTPLLVAAAAMAAIVWGTGQLDNWSAVQWLVAFAIFVGIVLVTVATILALITFESIWWCLVPFGVIGTITFVMVLANPHAEWTPPFQLATICCLYVTAVAAFWIARWRWQNWEVGQVM